MLMFGKFQIKWHLVLHFWPEVYDAWKIRKQILALEANFNIRMCCFHPEAELVLTGGGSETPARNNQGRTQDFLKGRAREEIFIRSS